MNHKAIGQRARQLRLQRGLTIEALSKKTRVSIAQISRLETGEHGFLRDKFLRFCKALKVPPAYFYAEEDEFPIGEVFKKLERKGLKLSRKARSLLTSAGFLEFAEEAARVFQADGRRLTRLEEVSASLDEKKPTKKRKPSRRRRAKPRIDGC